MVASEMVPFAKTGGLADVVSSLSAELARAGHDVRVVMPRYGWMDLAPFRATVALQPMGVPMGGTQEWCAVHKAVAKENITVYFVEFGLYFNRWGLYHGQGMDDYRDNGRRYGFLCRAALQLCMDLKFRPDIVHAHDWQTALAPAYLGISLKNEPFFARTGSVLTIHNIAYQGYYPKFDYDYLGLGWENFTPGIFESYNQINLLKGGIHYAQVVTTVSPGYAREIHQPVHGMGLSPFIARKGTNFLGILNGVDYALWSPERDPHIGCKFSAGDLRGKRVCKRILQRKFGLELDNHVALIGSIGRFAQQKGFDLVMQSIEKMLSTMPMQFIMLGAGEQDQEKFFKSLPDRFPGKAGSFIGFSNDLAHAIEAGCDLFLMPSRFEPCGLTQLYALRYGTLPVVRATGGLSDTVINYNQKNGEGTGFTFNDPTPEALHGTVGWAMETYYDRPDHFQKMMERAMRQDFSLKTTVKRYEEAYLRALEKKLTPPQS
jgi:starch synthase